MIKKITTYTLLFLFIASTTSIPLSETMCKMKGNFIGLYCPMMNHLMNKNTNSCGDTENNHSHHLSINSNQSCCSTRTIDNNIKDNYVIHDRKINIHPVFQFVHSDFYQQPLQLSFLLSKVTFKSAPPDIGRLTDLFITNSVFLI